MLFRNRELYDQTRSLKSGESQLSPFEETLRKRIAERFGIKILNIVYDRIEIGPSKGRPRLNVIVDSDQDQKRIKGNRFEFKKEAKDLILRDFADVVEQMGLRAQFETL